MGRIPFILPPDKRLRAGVISNPFSRGNIKGLSAVNKILRRHPHVMHCKAKTLTETLSALEEFERNEINLLIINGGDGTVQTVFTAMFSWKPFKSMPLIAILRGGTDSIIARDSGLKGRRERALNKLLNWVTNKDRPWRIVHRTVMKVDVASLQQPLYGMIFGAAVIYEASQFCHRNLHAKGLYGELAPGLTVARYVLGIIRRESKFRRAFPMTIHTDLNLSLKEDFLMVLITTVERLFFGLWPFWGVENNPLHVTLINARPKHMARVLASLAFGKFSCFQKPEYGYFSNNAGEVRLQFSGGFALDGELYPPASPEHYIHITNAGQVPLLKL